MKNQTTMKVLSIVIGFVIGVLVIIMGFKIVQNVFTRAEDIAPRDVVISDISQNSVKVIWATGQENQGVIEYGTSPTALNFFAPEPKETKNHSMELTLLSPSTTYYFQIRIGDKKFDNGGVPWAFSTKSIEKPVPTPILPSPTPQEEISSCKETDCAKIKEKIGKGCTARDYSICLRKPKENPK